MNHVRYIARFPTPHLIERGADTLVQCPVYYDDQLVLPTAGELKVYDRRNVEVFSSAAVAFPGSIATDTIPAAVTSGLAGYEEGWRAEWLLTLAAVPVRFRNDAVVCKYRLYPTIAGVDIAQRLRALDPSQPAVITTRTNFQPVIDECDIEVQNKMLELGKRPWLVSSPSALRQVWLLGSIALVLESLAVQNPQQYAETAKDWRSKFEAAFLKAAATFDYDDDGLTENPADRESLQPAVVWTC